jgi:hypothetical protein
MTRNVSGKAGMAFDLQPPGKVCACGCGAEVNGRGIYASRACSNRRTAAAMKVRAREDGPRPIGWACGGGVDSTAIAVLICQGHLPKPQFAWIVDVGYEPQTTWDHVHQVLQPKLAAAGVTLRVLRTLDHTDNLLVKHGHVTIPAYMRRPDGSLQKLLSRCSGPWKSRVAQRWLRSQGVEQIEQWIGIAADESQRVKASEKAWIRYRYPLVEMGLHRQDCVYLIGQAGWPMPERTSCWLCPHRSSGDWRRLRARSPDDFQRAVDVEQELQRTHPGVCLHRSGLALEDAVETMRLRWDEHDSCGVGLFACA